MKTLDSGWDVAELLKKQLAESRANHESAMSRIHQVASVLITKSDQFSHDMFNVLTNNGVHVPPERRDVLQQLTDLTRERDEARRVFNESMNTRRALVESLTNEQATSKKLAEALRALWQEAYLPKIYSVNDNGQRCSPYTSLSGETQSAVHAALADYSKGRT